MSVINRNSPQHLPALFLGAEPIEWADNVKDLGIYVESRLNFSSHVSEVCRNVYAALHRLRLLKHLPLRHIRMKFYKSLLLPYFYNAAKSSAQTFESWMLGDLKLPSTVV
jgi:hypothetical protein